MSDNYLLTNIAHLIGILGPEVSQLKGREMDGLESIHNAFVLVRNGIIVDYGSMDKCPTLEIETIDLSNKWVMPAFVDSHTHLVFAAPRHNEYVMRINGKTYAEIAADGNIHVYAPLRGKAMAGARGNTQARIFSLCFEPELVSIAGVYRTTEQELGPDVLGKPAQVRLSDDGKEKIIIEPLKT